MSNSLTEKLAAAAAASPEDKAAKEAADVAANAVAEPTKATMVTGTAAAGAELASARNKQGRASIDMRAPGYYSMHCGRVYLKGRSIDWPMHSPLVPEEDDKDLIAYLDHLVKTGKATKVEASKK